MTTPDPRTDLAGYLGLTDERAEDCRRSAPFHPGSVYTKIGARLIEQDQARAAEPDDGQLWSLGWTDANGEPVLTDLSRDDIEGFCQWVEDDRYVSHAISSLAQALQAALPAPKPPWKSPLDDLPDLTEEDCNVAYAWADRYEDDDNLARLDRDVSLMVQIGRALIAAGWTPEGEA